LAELEPREAMWVNNIAWTLLTGPPNGRDTKRALQLALRAVELDGKSALYRNTLGVAQYRNGLYREAVASLETSLAGNRGTAEGYDLYFLALCHHHLGHGEQARACYERAVVWQKKARLTPAQVQELNTFRAEAEGVLPRP
jgi:tetratricopeptide (TPR) repeat protein